MIDHFCTFYSGINISGDSCFDSTCGVELPHIYARLL